MNKTNNMFKEFLVYAPDSASFEIENSEKSMHSRFIAAPLGMATAYYAARARGDEDLAYDPQKEYKLCAVERNGVYYMLNAWPFDEWRDIYSISLPDQMKPFLFYKKELWCRLMEVEYPKFCKTLELMDGLAYPADVEEARKRLLGCEATPHKWTYDLSQTVALRVLCGEMTEDEFFRSVFKENKDKIVSLLSRENSIQRMVDNKTAAEDWEIEIGNALKDKQSVTVTFEKNGFTGTTKVAAGTVFKNLLLKDDFDRWSFPTNNGGERFITETMQLPLYGNKPDEKLYCSDIEAIVYRGENVYEKCPI